MWKLHVRGATRFAAALAVGLCALVTAIRSPAADPPTLPAAAWWSFQPPKCHAVPNVKRKDWPKSPIDAFTLAKLEENDLSPAPPADKRTLIRRATFDLTGLPPTPGEIHAFCADDSPDAFARVVDRLLASPAYGERWGRHWLDVVRYADTAGDGADYPVREAYKYRDYVIRSFNADKPYDAFLREQVAGDILAARGKLAPEAYAENVVATGFIAVGKRFGYRPNEAFRHLDIADTIEVLGRAVLGLSVGCARCHDHKYDPVSTADYYALYGIFDSSSYTFPGGEEHQKPDGLVPLVPPPQREAAETQWKARVAELDAKLKAASEDKAEKTPEAKKALTELKKQRDELAANPPYDVAYAITEGKPADARIQQRGERNFLGKEVPRGFLKVLGGQTLPADCKGSGRLELSGWLTDKTNPLTARVMVNRIWQHHFGRGIVKTSSDFGTRGSPPTHPELLDWLALQFMDSGWSIKSMHRLIMLSATYQQSATRDPQSTMASADAADPDNALLSHFSRRRLDAESIRDAMLFASGTLDASPAGPHPFPPVSQWRYTIHNPFYAVYESNRRSVYLMVQRQKKHPFLSLFDAADPNVSTEERATTITPAQSLYLMNDPFVHEKSAALAARVMKEAAEDGERVKLAYELTQAREPDVDELVRAGMFLGRYREKLAALGKTSEEQQQGAWSAFSRVLLTSNAFLFVD